MVEVNRKHGFDGEVYFFNEGVTELGDAVGKIYGK